MDKYHITARVTARPDCADELRQAIVANIPLVRQEQGCERYDLLISREAPNVFLFDEVWSDRAAFEAHGQAPHMQTYRQRTAHLLDTPTEICLWRAVDTQ